MKKHLSIILVGLLVLILTGCGKQTVNDIPREELSMNAPTEAPAAASAITPTDAPTEAAVSKFNIDWTEFTYSQKDNEGYTFDITVKLSPWILRSNTDVINQAWSEVGKNHEMPDFNDWGLNKDSGGYYWTPYSHDTNNGKANFNYGYWNYKMNDMYYCIGSVRIKNTTEGWNFSDSNPHSTRVQIQCNPVKTEAFFMSKEFYGNKTDVCWNGIDMSAKMKSDNWGSVPFIIMCPENFSPDNPNGEHIEKLKTVSLEVYQRKDIDPFRLNIIGKDTEQFEPVIAPTEK